MIPKLVWITVGLVLYKSFDSNQCVFLTKFLQVFRIWYAKTCTKIKMHVSWHARFRIWHVVWLVKKKVTLRLTLSKLKWHVLLGMWHWGNILEEDVDVKWHSFLFLKMSCDTLDLKLNIKWNLSNIHTDSNKNKGMWLATRGFDIKWHF